MISSAAEILEEWPAGFGRRRRGSRSIGVGAWRPRASHHLHHSRYVGHQVSPPLPLAVFAELVSAFLNNGMAEYEMGPAANAMERRVIDWLGRRSGFDCIRSKGCSLPAGQPATSRPRGRAAVNRGVRRLARRSSPTLSRSVLVSDQAHYSVDRAARILGLGAAVSMRVPTDSRFRLDPAALREARFERRRRDAGVRDRRQRLLDRDRRVRPARGDRRLCRGARPLVPRRRRARCRSGTVDRSIEHSWRESNARTP